MSRIFYFSFFLVFVCVSNNSYSQASKDDIDKAIDLSSLKHPYLYFTEEEKPALLEGEEGLTLKK